MNTPFLDNNESMPLIRSLRFGIWQIALAAQIKSVLFLNFFKLFAVLKVKNLLIVLILFLFAINATFLDGSTPKILVLLDLKFFKKVPSFDPIPITVFTL